MRTHEKQAHNIIRLAVIAIILALAIFIALPQFLTGFLPFDKTSIGLEGLWFNLIEGGIRLVIFILYILLISLIPSLRRVFMYHGAEHKTISCYEKGEELTVENIRKCSRVHDRCGTTFLFLVMVVSILVFSLANVAVGAWLYGVLPESLHGVTRFVFKMLLLPVVAGVSYEILRLLSKTDSKFFYIFKIPGLLLQRLTTREPDDSMIECAVAAFQTVMDMEADATIPEKVFAVPGKMTARLKITNKRCADNGIDEEEAEWIFALTLKIPKSAVNSTERILKVAQVKEILRIADERLTGRPLWYVIGDTDFYGYKIKVDERVLIPRPETEELAALVVGVAEEGQSILDLCTGSGAIAVAVYKELEKSNRKAKVTAVDISADALELAKENAEANGAQWSRGEDDERITPIGKVLRRTKFDEIPQLFNCLIGNLSIVGPRPEREIFYNCFETYVHGFSQRLLVKPGITGLAQIKGGYFLKPEEKIIYDIEYIKTRSLWTDFKILLSTVSVVIRGDGSK